MGHFIRDPMPFMTNPPATSHTKQYLVIFGWLVALTIFEIVVALMHFPTVVLAILLVASSLGKAMLIGLYFMHLKFESRVLWFLPAAPVVFAILFVFGIFPDIVYHAIHRF